MFNGIQFIYSSLPSRTTRIISIAKWIGYFPLSLAWITLNFNLHRIEAKLSRKVIYLLSFTLLLVSSIIISFGIKLPVLIAFVLILAGLSFGYIYTKDSVIVQEETSPLQMKKMMSFYGLTKNLGASIGSTIMGYLYGYNQESLVQTYIMC